MTANASPTTAPDPASTKPAAEEDTRPEAESWATLRRFLPYLWPKGDWPLRRRIVIALTFVLLAKAVTLTLPFFYAGAVDAMSEEGLVDEAVLVAFALVAGYALGRFTQVAFDNIRNMAFERVEQEAILKLSQDVFHRLHRLSLRFHLSRRTGEVTKVIERGTKSIGMMLYFMLFNIAPTAIELIAVGLIFYFKFGIELVAATAFTVIAYVLITRWITEWRAKLRREMNDLDGKALHRAVDSLLNFETVKYFGAEQREEERYSGAARAYAEAAIKSESSLGLLNIAQSAITNLLMGGAMAYIVWGWSRGQ
ncbi:MAG: ABC transporter transmembrane domain-containing protein, partial [Pseudomonadota bacterium]